MRGIANEVHGACRVAFGDHARAFGNEAAIERADTGGLVGTGDAGDRQAEIAHVRVGDEKPNIFSAQQRLKGGDQQDVAGAQDLIHATGLHAARNARKGRGARG